MNNKNGKTNEHQRNNDDISLNADERDNATEDDYGEFEGADVEDEAPEAVQAHSSVGSPWATFPDLVRVPTSTSSAVDDDPPESLTFTQRSRNGIALDSGFNIDSVFNANRLSDTGARPKTRPLAPPDISQIGSIASPSSSASSSSSSSGSSSANAGATASSSATTISPESNVPFKPSAFKVTSFPPKNSATVSSTNNTSNPVGISCLKQNNKPSSISLSGGINTFPSTSRYEQANNDNTSISLAINRLQNTVDTLSRDLNSRLNAIEERLNNLSINSSSGSITDTTSSNTNMIRTIREELQLFNQLQRQGIDEERSALLMTLSEAMRRAASTKNNNHGVNGPR